MSSQNLINRDHKRIAYLNKKPCYLSNLLIKMKYNSFFWLHIKKSAGITTRNLLSPHYIEVENREKQPKTFIQADPTEYNDIINNYRLVLGDYQFKRSLFAKKYLFPNNWETIYSFAFSREPMDRCLSMFYYLHYSKRKPHQKVMHLISNLKNRKKFGISKSYDFDVFLEYIKIAHYDSDSIYVPAGLHFSTHTAPMFKDVSDKNGNLLLTKIFRLENLKDGIKEALNECNLKPSKERENILFNRNSKRGNFIPNKEQRRKVFLMYEKDFELYENAY